MWVVGHLGVGGAPLRLEKRDMAIDINELRKVIADCYWPTSPVTINELLDRLEAAEAECLEQARLNGMGSEREAALMAKLEAAEIERDSAKKLADSLALALNTSNHERDNLRAKIAEMEKQEPAGKFIRHPSNGLWEQDGYGDNPDARPLYALPGAQGEEK